jgi:hypothetical protein
LTLTDEEFAFRWLAAEGLVARGPLLQALTQMLEVRSILRHDGTHHILCALITDELKKAYTTAVFTVLNDIDFQVKVPPAVQKALQSFA